MIAKLKCLVIRLWRWCKTPSKLAIGLVLLIGAGAGLAVLGGVHTGLAMTSTPEFCISCHEMEAGPYQEYVQTVHYTNRSGVQATCPDCHVPKEFGPKMIRKMQAAKELYAKAFGLIDTPQKFEDNRLAMATREWARMKANDSQECRNCHNPAQMDLSVQKTAAATVHSKAFDAGQTCIDCHKGIAHQLPKGVNAGKEFAFH